AKPTSAPQFPRTGAPMPGTKPTFPVTGPRIWNVPHLRNPNFTGRVELLKALDDAMADGGTAAVTQAIAGLGGVGKTQIANEYCYRNRGRYEIIWWVHSEEPAKLASDYAGLAGRLGLPEANQPDLPARRDAVRRWLEQYGGWLLVFDNVPHSDSVREYLPRTTSGHVIITSRDQNWGGIAKTLGVHEWSRPESVKFLIETRNLGNPTAADELAESLGDLPLALEQAAAYMEQSGRTIPEYLQLYRDRSAELLKEGKPLSGYEHVVSSVWSLSFAEVERESEAAAQLLKICAFLAPDQIPLDLLALGAVKMPPPLREDIRDPLERDRCISVLRRYSLVEPAADDISLHRLVQRVTKDGLAHEEMRQYLESVTGTVSAVLPSDVLTNPAAWPIYKRLLAHALAAASEADEYQVLRPLASWLFDRCGTFLQATGDLYGARQQLERGLRIAEGVLGGDSPVVSPHLSNLGLVLHLLGDLPSARQYLERALRLAEEGLGPEDRSVAFCLGILGNVVSEMGDFHAARTLLERAMLIFEGIDGPHHPNVAITLGRLGLVVEALGDLRGAIELHKRALHITEGAYGHEHPEVARTLINIGACLLAFGDPDGARQHIERSLHIGRNTLGPDHPDIGVTLSHLGLVLQALGDPEGARVALDESLHIFRRTLGDDHPDTRAGVALLASLEAKLK
ncbi:MAG: FxSxx-COOH system tetratricopeptide repeat protein, partial [Candidatus Zixiibacteriota bacterium]